MNYLIKTNWWKILTVILLSYTVIGGLLFGVPRLAILNETIRNLHFHVPMWFGMVVLFGFSFGYSIRYLKSSDFEDDLFAQKLAETGILFGLLGMITGMVWANFTWGEPWSNDPKQNAAAVALLIYFAMFILRGSVIDERQKFRLFAVYNVFAYPVFISLIFILPRLTDSLHPGSGGNPGFNAYDLDSRLRLVFYPAVIGWIFMSFWIASLKIRIAKIEYLNNE